MAADEEPIDTMMMDEQDLLDYLEDTIIPCASCGTQIDVDDSVRWVNRLVCEECIEMFEGLTADDEANYDDAYEEDEE